MAITTIGGNINSTAVLANLDYKYGPYNSLQEAYDTLGPNGVDKLAIGLTVGIIEDGRIREYWFKSGTDSVNNLVLKSEGKSAYDIAVEEGFEGTEQEWVDSLKGEKGNDAINPFKGWYDSYSNLPENPVIGDYAYVKGAESTDPAAIYECTTAGSWSDSGRTADTSNVQTFASNQEVNEVNIVNNLTDGGVDDVLSAEQGKVLGNALKINLDIIQILNDKYIAANGTIIDSTSTPPRPKIVIYEIPNIDVTDIYLHVISSGNSATKLFAFGSSATQTTDLVAGDILGNSGEISVTAVNNHYKYLFVCCYPDAGIECSCVVPNSLQSLEDSLNPTYKISILEHYIWSGGNIGDVVSLTAVPNLEFDCSQKVDVSYGDEYCVYGTGGTGGSRLWAILDADNKILSVATSGESHPENNPLKITIDNPSAKFLVATFSTSAGDTYGLFNYNPEIMGRVFMHLDTINNEIVDLQKSIVGNINNILLDGASFAYPDNSWFSKLCSRLHIEGINKAVSGESIKNMAIRMSAGTEYTAEQLEDFDILMIMHVHNQDVADTTGILDDYTQYTVDLNMTYAQAYDYVLKKYAADCYNLKNDSNSKWYNYPMGKPCIVVCLTHWNDSRTIFNSSIRTLKDKWGFHLVELDKNIGFSKNQVNSVTNEQVSRLYAQDTETIDGVVYGWHPKRSGNGANIIQNKIADICFNVLSEISVTQI